MAKHKFSIEEREGVYYLLDKGKQVTTPNGVVVSTKSERLAEATFLHIENRQLSFTYNNSEFKSHIIEDVEAIALQNTLGVESYKEIVDYFFEKFGGKDGVNIFKTFLDTNGTAYSERGTF